MFTSPGVKRVEENDEETSGYQLERETFLSRWKGDNKMILVFPANGEGEEEGSETKEREMEKYVGDVCVDAETGRDKFPRIAWNRQNRSLFYGEYSM